MKSLNRVLMAALCTSAMTAPAYAQDAAVEEVDDNVIIVTATRRAQDVQDIPLAVTAVSPAQLEQQGVVNVQNIGSVSPSFSTSNAQIASGSVVLRIRGVGTTSNNIGFESAVGIFIDGAYQSRPGIALTEFVDVERVEVLRGPQGTLFGRNTSAGALNITNVRPDLNEFGGFANATYGNFDLVNVQGAVNLPIVQDSVALRVTGAYRQQDGTLDVLDRNGTDIGSTNDVDQFLIRAQLGFESSGGIEGRLIGDYSRSTSSCCGAVELLQGTVETGGGFAAVGLGARGGQSTPIFTDNPNDQSTITDILEDRVTTASFLPVAEVDQWGITGEITVPIGDTVDAIFIASYRQFDSTENYDSDFTGLDIFDIDDLSTSIDTFTAELRFQGELFDGRLNWLVGGFYSDETIDSSTTASLGADYDALAGALFGGAAGPAPLALFSGQTPNGISNTNNFEQDSESYSIFTHNSFEIADGLELTAGLRYSNESKTGGFSQSAVNNPVCSAIISNVGLGVVPPGAAPAPPLGTALGNGLFGLGCFAFTAPANLPTAGAIPTPVTFAGTTFDDDEFIYTLKASYEFAAPINIYASFTHGYKSGGINLDSTAAIAGADPTFASEEVDAYEIGLKAKFLDGAVTFNLAGFHEEFSNFQVLEFTGAQFETFNVPTALSTGVEIESVIRPTDGLTINAGLTWTDARYPNDCDDGDALAPVNVQGLCGNSLTNAPELVAILGATYTQDFSDNLNWFVNGQIRTESDRRTSTQAIILPNAAAIAAAGSIPAAIDNASPLPFDVQDGNIKINLRAGLGSQDKSWGIEAWVQNLTNEVTRGVTFNTVLRGTSRSAFIQQPRTFGVTLRGAF
ncbi:MAG: TonB-dependent receptor [Parasphingorhabdus sp.]|uniref:TonB-dependent receptor n=1 Tax=Parasphingorhabdus sp. TaxID=2709688 RepID=UPI003297FDEA